METLTELLISIRDRKSRLLLEIHKKEIETAIRASEDLLSATSFVILLLNINSIKAEKIAEKIREGESI